MGKDLAEQLRVVHLSLLLIALIVVAANLAEQRGPLKLAYDDAAKISEIARRDAPFKTEALKQTLHDFALDSSRREKTPPDVSTSPFVYVTVNKQIIYTLDRRDQFLAGHPGNSSPEDLQSFDDIGLAVFWDSLNDFIRAWDNSPPVIPNPLRYRKEFGAEMKLPSNCQAEVVLTPATAVSDTILAGGVHYDHATHEATLVLRFEDPLKRPKDEEPRTCAARMPLGVVQDVGIDIRAVLRNVAGTHWTSTPFEEAFPSLSASTKYLRSLALPDLLNHLQEESTKEGEKVEMFGAKIPYELVNIFGSVFLVACQFYLLCHLVEFTNRAHSRSSEQEFTGYIGLYDDQAAARIFTVLSVSVIPSAVLAFTIWKNRGPIRSWLEAGVALAFSIGLGWLLAKNFRELWNAKKRLPSHNAEKPESVRTSSGPGDGQPENPVAATRSAPVS